MLQGCWSIFFLYLFQLEIVMRIVGFSFPFGYYYNKQLNNYKFILLNEFFLLLHHQKMMYLHFLKKVLYIRYFSQKIAYISKCKGQFNPNYD